MSTPPDTPCVCGETQTLELVRDVLEGIVCEADHFCLACKRHRGFEAYGAWLPGTGELITAAEEQAMARARVNLTHIQRALVA